MSNVARISQLCVAYTTKASVPVLTAPTNQQLLVYSMSAYQREGTSGANYLTGIGYGFSPTAFKAYSALGVTTDVTEDLADGTTTVLLEQTIGNAFVVEAKKQFGMIVLGVVQAQGGSPVYALEYWNGSTWVATPALETVNFSGETVISFGEPILWSNTANPYTAGYYSIRVRVTTAGNTNVSANSLRVAKMFTFRDPAQYNQVQAFFGDSALLLEQGEYMLPYFSEDGNANLVEVSYKLNP